MLYSWNDLENQWIISVMKQMHVSKEFWQEEREQNK